MDADIVAVSPTTIYRVLRDAGHRDRWALPPSSKGDGFTPPLQAHQHWHIDIAYLNLAGTFYYLCSILDGFSRFIVHWEIQEQMKEADVELILQRGLEEHPDARPRAITDCGPQFVARDFQQFIRLSGMTLYWFDGNVTIVGREQRRPPHAARANLLAAALRSRAASSFSIRRA